MPDWFAKTKEMVAADHWFSLVHAGSEEVLVDRYKNALTRLDQTPETYASGAEALDGQPWANTSVDDHFVGDWLHYRYYEDPAVFGDLGGDFWPQVPSSEVAAKLRTGMQLAIHKALGFSHMPYLQSIPFPGVGILGARYFSKLWGPELANGVDINGVRSLAMSWNCVAPPGEHFFQVAALRGPSVVELAIATPKPYGNSSMMRVATRLIDGWKGYEKIPDEPDFDPSPMS